MGNKHRTGFTIIEVVLFIGISGFLIIGLIVGTSATIARQRYNDSVQDLAEYFRREYSAVINPENGRIEPVDESICDGANVSDTTSDLEGPARGRSGCLIYGRLIVIGENVAGAEPNTIWSYDVIGRELGDEERAANTLLKASLKLAGITPLARTNVASATDCSYQPIGAYRYAPQWLATVEDTTTDPTSPAAISILIVRSPASGSVHTLVIKDYAIDVQATAGDTCSSNVAKSILTERIDNPALPYDFQFQLAEADLCVGSEDIFASGGVRRNVRLARDGHNVSAVELIDQDNIYDELENPGGNRCAS